MEINYFELIGGENLKRLISDFYSEISNDSILRPMYPSNLEAAEERLYLFMQQFLGGPKAYNELRGEPRLRRRHVPFKVDKTARDRWMEIMNRAIEKNSMDDIAKYYLTKYFSDTATFLINTNISRSFTSLNH